jgi:plasmid stabilization system protein ParE
MTETNRALSFAPVAEDDIEGEVDYLREHASDTVADDYLRSVYRTTALLLTAPYIGRVCGFKPVRYREVRRFPVHAPFQKRLLFYTPDLTSVRVERILHGARNWAVLFR